MINNSSIRARLLFLIGFMSLILLVVGIAGIVGISAVSKGINEVYHGGVDSIQSLNKLSYLYRYNITLLIQKLHDGMSSWEEVKKQIIEAQDEIAEQWSDYTKTERDDNQKELSRKLEQQMHKANASLAMLQDILNRENTEQLDSYIKNDLYSVFPGLGTSLSNLIDAHVISSADDLQRETARASTMKTLMIAAIILGILLGLLIALFIVHSITTPITSAVEVVDQFAEGDTSVSFDNKSKDEVGQLLNSMQRMLVANKKLISAFETVATGNLVTNVPLRSDKDSLGIALNDMIKKLRATVVEVQAEANVLASSTEEIVASIAQVSSGTAETAAAVTETTTTVEELKQTAQVSTEKAQDVLKSAENTLKVVSASEQSLKSTIEDMNQIQDKMRVISDSIIALSKNSLTILEIINTVNDLAEQSNLLAVNAAIEAAKAGDQGKSFGVVAQEIRILAEQSKAATVQVRAILNDIQNSTSAAVMATEQGSKAVSKGVSQSLQTGESIKSLTLSINDVAQAAKQIAISSQQQLVGVDQVTIAMTNINEATSQHVEHIKQIQEAVVAMNAVGSTLKQLINRYKL